MKLIATTEDKLAELMQAHEAIKVVLECLLENAACPRVQTLACVANDYVVQLEQTVKAMHK